MLQVSDLNFENNSINNSMESLPGLRSSAWHRAAVSKFSVLNCMPIHQKPEKFTFEKVLLTHFWGTVFFSFQYDID